jgi:ribosomal protein L37E
MSKAPYTCRRCGRRLGEVQGDELRLAPATIAAFDVRRRSVRVKCPRCGTPRTFGPAKQVVKVTTSGHLLESYP